MWAISLQSSQSTTTPMLRRSDEGLLTHQHSLLFVLLWVVSMWSRQSIERNAESCELFVFPPPTKDVFNHRCHHFKCTRSYSGLHDHLNFRSICIV